MIRNNQVCPNDEVAVGKVELDIFHTVQFSIDLHGNTVGGAPKKYGIDQGYCLSPIESTCTSDGMLSPRGPWVAVAGQTTTTVKQTTKKRPGACEKKLGSRTEQALVAES